MNIQRHHRRALALSPWTGLLALALLCLPNCVVVGCAVGGEVVQDEPARSEESSRGFRRLPGLYEPSGVAQLTDGRLLVVEDERARPFALLSPGDGELPFRVESARASSLADSLSLALDDLEAITAGPDGFLVAITSHSRKDNGKLEHGRQRMVRFKVEGSRLSEVAVATGLRKALPKAYPSLRDAARERKVKRDVGLNIEGLAFDRKGRRLWIGLRGPLLDGKALLVQLLNPKAVFGRGADFRFARKLVELDLDGGGIRDLAYVPRLNGYLILSQREGGKGKHKKEKKFKLWLWSGDSSLPARRVRIAGVSDLESAEGIAPIRWAGSEQLLLLSDDGNLARRKSARYLLIDYSALTIESPNH